MRIACLHVPSFPLAVWYRADPELCGRPVAVAEGEGVRARIVACSPEASRLGIVPGAGAAQARAVCAGLVVRPRCPAAERAAQEALCDVADGFSPRVEDGGDGMVFLAADGLCALERGCGHAPYESETDLARALHAASRRVGLAANVGVASTKVAANLAARDGGGVMVIPREQEWHFLAPLPIGLLDPSPPLRETLARWGIHRLGELMALPAAAVAERLGPEGRQLVRRARGEDDFPLHPRPAPLRFEESVDLDYGLENLEGFLFVVRPLLDRLLARLAVRGLVCGDLHLDLRLSHRGHDTRTIVVAAPGNDVKSLLTLVRLQLESHPPIAPVETVRLAAVPERLRPVQLDLFRPAGPTPEKWGVTLARLSTLCGPERVGSPRTVDSHRPEAWAVVPFDPNPPPLPSELPPERADPSLRLALRALRPPLSLEVFHDRGRLDFVRWQPTAEPSDGADREPECRCTGRVVTLAGPWRMEGEWWQTDGGFRRDYYDVQLSDGAVYRLFQDLQRQAWFCDGVYD